mgnify:CR=1 FL=1|jgi:cysteine-rich repeat protein|tara:strand:+ start:2934 stop:4343 length:1410 start_codon:yes stop_codon:yes gene_type:complete
MKKHLFLFFFIILVLSSFSYAQSFGVETSSGEEGGFIITDFQVDKFTLAGLLQPQAIIPSFVNAGSVIEFKGELRKVSDFTGFLFGVPDTLVIRIYKFDSTKSNFLGEKVNTFTIQIPDSAKQSMGDPLTTIIIFDAKMTAPTQVGKYRYEAEPRFGNFRETAIELDFDTFTVTEGVPEACKLPTIETTFEDIEGGKRKIITTTEEFGLDCTVSTIKTYNAICDGGYRATGSGSSINCGLIAPSDPPPVQPPVGEGCSPSQVCCEYSDYQFVDGKNEKSRVTACLAPTECKWFSFSRPEGSAVPNQQCGGSNGGGVAQICGDSAIQSPETCDDGNLISGDGCSSLCKFEDDEPPPPEICSKPNGAACTLEPLAGNDDTQPSDECKSGICVDVTGVGGRCGTKTSVEGIKIEPNPTCKALLDLEKGEGFDFAQLNPCVWGEQISEENGCLVGWGIVGIIGLLIVLGGRRR